MDTEYNRNDITLIIIFSTKNTLVSSTVVVAKRVRKCLCNKGEIYSTYFARADLSRRRGFARMCRIQAEVKPLLLPGGRDAAECGVTHLSSKHTHLHQNITQPQALCCCCF